jgi:hypothetical protein
MGGNPGSCRGATKSWLPSAGPIQGLWGGIQVLAVLPNTSRGHCRPGTVDRRVRARISTVGVAGNCAMLFHRASFLRSLPKSRISNSFIYPIFATSVAEDLLRIP